MDVKIPGYRILRTLGAGGMATVYLAEQQSLEREVALKVMAPALAANADFCQQFLKEGRITAKLNHPNLVTVHDIGCHDGVYYMASEFLPAGSLRERMQRGLDIGAALAIACDVASGLSYAHEMGFVHRDVKPGNILFRASGAAVLADFGIAKAMKTVSSATIAGNAIGTPDYMSPEQAQATLVDGRTDIYSLGAVLYEMLSGRKPYVASDPYAVALRHVTEPVPRLPEGLAALQPLIDKAMAKDREQRLATGADFIAECNALSAAFPLRAARRQAASTSPAPATDASAAWRWLPQDRRIAWLAAAAALFAAAFAGVWLWPRPPAAPPPHTEVVQPVDRAPDVSPSDAPDAGPRDAVAAAGLDRLDTAALLARARAHLDQGLKSQDGRFLAFPDGDNAIDLFREVLKRDPGNAVATQGLARICDFYVRGARSAFDRGFDTAADELVEKGLRAAPDNGALLKLRADLKARLATQGG